jgi:hypothetical protein
MGQGRADRGEARNAGDRASGMASEAAGEARGMAGQLVGEVREAAESLLDEGKDRAIEAVHGVADALRRTAEGLEESDGAFIARYAHQAADQIERFSENFRERRLTDIVADVEDFARRQPTVFLLGAVAAGFIAGRFMSASAERRHAEAGSSYGAGAHRASDERRRQTYGGNGGTRAGYGATAESRGTGYAGTRGSA